jgi:hypothetical protein
VSRQDFQKMVDQVVCGPAMRPDEVDLLYRGTVPASLFFWTLGVYNDNNSNHAFPVRGLGEGVDHTGQEGGTKGFVRTRRCTHVSSVKLLFAQGEETHRDVHCDRLWSPLFPPFPLISASWEARLCGVVKSIFSK